MSVNNEANQLAFKGPILFQLTNSEWLKNRRHTDLIFFTDVSNNTECLLDLNARTKRYLI